MLSREGVYMWINTACPSRLLSGTSRSEKHKISLRPKNPSVWYPWAIHHSPNFERPAAVAWDLRVLAPLRVRVFYPGRKRCILGSTPSFYKYISKTLKRCQVEPRRYVCSGMRAKTTSAHHHAFIKCCIQALTSIQLKQPSTSNNTCRYAIVS